MYSAHHVALFVWVRFFSGHGFVDIQDQPTIGGRKLSPEEYDGHNPHNLLF